MRKGKGAAISLLLGVLGASAARAEGMDLLSRETLGLSGDVRLVAADGERSWLDKDNGRGGYGKGRFGSDGDLRLRPELVEGSIAWQPRFNWSLSGTIVGIAQKGQDHGVDLSEAFLSFRPKSIGTVRLSARAGLFWPPVSLEHGGRDWAVTETITPSAINSWIGEEVKLVGAEASLSAPIGEGRVTATGALFDYNDTAGTLLAFRGWALHDEKATAFGRQPLPPQNAFITAVQSTYTRPIIALDHRVGWYAKLAWYPPLPFRIEALHYDNRGNPQAVDAQLQWGWRTRFTSLALVATPAAHLDIKAQALGGTTRMGFARGGVIWVDTHYRSAFLLATRRFDGGSVSARIEAFGTRNYGSTLLRDDNEDGWAVTLAARRPIGGHAALLGEILHIDSHRDARARLGENPDQRQTIGQIALRMQL